jgi:hypothetical protein
MRLHPQFRGSLAILCQDFAWIKHDLCDHIREEKNLGLSIPVWNLVFTLGWNQSSISSQMPVKTPPGCFTSERVRRWCLSDVWFPTLQCLVFHPLRVDYIYIKWYTVYVYIKWYIYIHMYIMIYIIIYLSI